jgi:hypothetical protein
MDSLVVEKRRTELLWDQETGTWSGPFRCRGCGRFLGNFSGVKMGGYDAPPCRTKTCDGYVNRLGFETISPPV